MLFGIHCVILYHTGFYTSYFEGYQTRLRVAEPTPHVFAPSLVSFLVCILQSDRSIGFPSVRVQWDEGYPVHRRGDGSHLIFCELAFIHPHASLQKKHVFKPSLTHHPMSQRKPTVATNV